MKFEKILKSILMFISLFILCTQGLFGQINSASMERVGEFGYSYTGNVLNKIKYDKNNDFVASGFIWTYVG